MKNGWQRKQIRDLCEVIAGQSPEGKFYNADGEGMPFYQGKKDFGDRFITAPTTWTTQTTKVAQEGDILMSVRAPVGPINFATGEVCIGRGLAAIRCGSELNRDFLFYQLLHLQPDIAGKEGAVFASINKSEIEALPLAFSPLSEQQRIVGILDEAFEGIAIAKANTEKNLQNARALFESHLQSVFTQQGDGWVKKQLGDLAELRGRIGWRGLTAKEYTKTGPLFLSVHSLNYGDYVDFRDAFHISQERYKESPEIILQKDDVLICKDGAGIGKLGIVGELPGEATINSSLLLIRSSKSIHPKFLYWCLSSPYFQRIVNSRLNGATTPHLYQRDITEFPVLLPPFTDQERILAMLDTLRSEAHHLESIYLQKLVALEELKKSLLHQAFSGEL